MRSPLLFCLVLPATIHSLTRTLTEHNNAVFRAATPAGDIVRDTLTQYTTQRFSTLAEC